MKKGIINPARFKKPRTNTSKLWIGKPETGRARKYHVREGDRVNAYVCQSCKRYIGTVDIDEGVTPFMIECPSGHNCLGDGDAKSSFYSVKGMPLENVTHGWIREQRQSENDPLTLIPIINEP